MQRMIKVFKVSATQSNWNIQLLTQPARSLDLNVNNSGFFALLQTEYWKFGYLTKVQEIINKVKQAYNKHSPIKLSKTWLTLCSKLESIVELHGGNNYKIQHMGKDRIIR